MYTAMWPHATLPDNYGLQIITNEAFPLVKCFDDIMNR